ncbi:hypothetical protein [Tanticharoenia sakaeratensis]|uniref:hypothetical protein n=1 Tax=Tanticharoenia sakaeratensis TaxID=444053 RepID=UPI00130E6CF0|nr:hypothetical protein [Tanticharoenia sakaeratensis]
MFTIGAVGTGVVLAVLVGLFFWLDDRVENKLDENEAKPDPEADAEFEHTMQDIEKE